MSKHKDPDGWLHAVLANSHRMHERAFSNLADAAKQEIARRDARIAELEAALRGLDAMYTHAWDLADGSGLMMMSASIPRFEEAHRQARIALGEPLIGDDDIDPDAALCDPRRPEGKVASVSGSCCEGHEGLVGAQAREVPDGS